MKIDEVPDMATIKETAEIFKLPEYFVRQLVKSGKVIAIKSGRKIFGKEEVDGSNPLNSSSINHIATPFARNCERRLFSFFCRLGHYEGTNSIKK